MSTSLQNIIDLIRFRSNMENNNFVTDDELALYTNSSLAELDDILVTEYEDYRVDRFQSVLDNSGTNNIIPIPSNMYKLRGVDYQLTNTGGVYWLTLYPFQMPERNRQRSGLTNILLPYRTGLSYRLLDTGIEVMPVQQAAGIYQVWYTPKFTQLTSFDSLLPLQIDTQSWIEYVVVDCCIKIFNKQNLDPSGFLADKAALATRIKGAAKNRDAAAPKRIANVRYEDDTLGMPWNFYNV